MLSSTYVSNARIGPARGRLVDVILIALVAFDLLVAAGAFLLPQLWYRLLHDAAYVDPQGLLRRTGAIWAAFAAVQILALPRWRRAAHWLLLVTGIRLSELFADWTYLVFAESITPFGTAALLATLPANLLICWFLYATWRKLAGRGGPASGGPAGPAPARSDAR